MGERVRRIRLLVVAGAASLLALVTAWPSPGAAAADAPSFYLARERPGATVPAKVRLAVGDGPWLVTHLALDRQHVAELQVIDSTGRVVALRADGQADATGETVEPAVVRSWLLSEFHARRQALDEHMRVHPRGAWCGEKKVAARGFLDLPSHRDGRELTLAETLAEAENRLEVMHLPENDMPLTCFTRDPPSSHRGGYLHNLWHRITGTASPTG